MKALRPRWLPPLAVSFFVIAALLSSGEGAPPAAAQTGPLEGRSICIDPGHGGAEPGAANAEFGLVEKNINLDVATQLRASLDASGATVYMTREGDETVSIRQRYQFCNGTGADILVSVHTNSVSDQTVDGTLAIYFHRDDKVLATALNQAMYAQLSNVGWEFLDFGSRRDALGVVLKSDMPAAVAEPVFMSHPGEGEWLAHPIADCSDPGTNACRRAQIAQSLYDGIASYFENVGEEPDGPGAGKGRGKKPR